jgi:hypothetical protein
MTDTYDSDEWTLSGKSFFDYSMIRHAARWSLGRALPPLAWTTINELDILDIGFYWTRSWVDVKIAVCDLVPYLLLPFVLAGNGEIPEDEHSGRHSFGDDSDSGKRIATAR